MDPSEHVPRFLSAQTKKIVLNNDNLSQNVLSVLRTPEAEYQDYTVVEIDCNSL